MQTRDIEIINKRGLHARASAKFVRIARQFDCEITVAHKSMTVPATSVMGLMMLVAGKGSTITLSGQGQDIDAALDALEELISSKFDEE